MSTARRALAAGGLIAVTLAGYVVAQSALGGRRSGTASVTRRPAASTSTGRIDPMPMAVTGAGSVPTAVLVATAYLHLVDGGSNATQTVAAVRLLTLPPLTGQALQALTAGAAVARRLSAHPPVLRRGWELGWDLESQTGSDAVVAVWTVGIVDSLSEVVPPDFSTTVCWMRWTDDRWKVYAARTVPGPTPPSDPSEPAVAAAFARKALEFHPFDDAP